MESKQATSSGFCSVTIAVMAPSTPATVPRGALSAVSVDVASPTNQGLLNFNDMPVIVSRLTSQVQVLPDNILSPVALLGGGNPVMCINCCRVFAFNSSDITGITPPPGFSYTKPHVPPPIPIATPMPLQPTLAHVGANTSLSQAAPLLAPLLVCSDPSHFILTMGYMPNSVLPNLAWSPCVKAEHEDMVRPSLGPSRSVDLDLGL